MTFNQDWRGTHLISAKPTPEQRASINSSLVARLSHKKRTAKGTNMSKAKGPWARSMHFIARDTPTP